MRLKKRTNKRWWREEDGWTQGCGQHLQDGFLTMNKILGEPINQDLPREITEECNEASRSVVELSAEALARIEQIEASARLLS